MTPRVLPFVLRRGVRPSAVVRARPRRPDPAPAPAVAPMLERGVWVAPYQLGGATVLIAIDSKGRWVGEVVARDEGTQALGRSVLGVLLDAEDPAPSR